MYTCTHFINVNLPVLAIYYTFTGSHVRTLSTYNHAHTHIYGQFHHFLLQSRRIHYQNLFSANIDNFFIQVCICLNYDTKKTL